LNEHNDLTANEFPVSPEQLGQLILMVEKNSVSYSTASQKILPILLANPAQNPETIAQENNWLQNSDSGALEQIIDEVLAAMPDKVAEYRKGKKGLLGLFVGEVMKKSKGSADPKITNQLVISKLSLVK
jgi:aspartyl-tRNA(Asn)/glutamyl-tRNA(Gln) amidotransferase subunit B